MKTWDDRRSRFALEELPCSDSLLLDQLLPLSDKEIESIEALCEQAGPGPLVIDDVADGGGRLVATLADGRHVISLSPSGDPDDPSWIEAHARLICRSRSLLMRLLHDRRRMQREREQVPPPPHATDPALEDTVRFGRPKRPR